MHRTSVTAVFFCTLLSALVVAVPGVGHADEKELPAGPIHDRHELMEDIGKNAKTIGDALKSGNLEPVAKAAEDIHADATKACTLFPKGSEHEASRAKPEIWQKWDEFERLCKELGTTSAELAAVAKAGGDVKTAANAMFGNCKSCHDDFRKPEEKDGH